MYVVIRARACARERVYVAPCTISLSLARARSLSRALSLSPSLSYLPGAASAVSPTAAACATGLLDFEILLEEDEGGDDMLDRTLLICCRARKRRSFSVACLAHIFGSDINIRIVCMGLGVVQCTTSKTGDAGSNDTGRLFSPHPRRCLRGGAP